MSGGKAGALYSLAHRKANALNALRAMAEELLSCLNENQEDEGLDNALSILEARGKKLKEIELLDQRMAFLADSGYTPEAAEARRVAAEGETIEALLRLIQGLDEQTSQRLYALQASLMESLKEVKDGQRSIQAYAPLPEEEEGRQVDTLR